MKKKNMIIIGIIALILAVSVGYALFSDTLNINGTATAKGDFSLSYKCATQSEGIFPDENYVEGLCETNGNTITTISNLTKPKEGTSYLVTVTNNGTIPVVLKHVTSPNNKDGTFIKDGDETYVDTSTMLCAFYEVIKDNNRYHGDSLIENSNISINPGDSIEISIEHHWIDSEPQPEIPDEGATINYNLTFEFEQTTN